MESSLRNLKLISKISHEITSTLDINEVMTLTYENLKEIMDVSYFFITSYNEDTQDAQIIFCVKEGIIIQNNFQIILNNPNSLNAFVIKNKKEIIIDDFELEYTNYMDEFPIARKEDLPTRSVILIPLLFKAKLIGLFSVQSVKSNAFSTIDIEMLRSLSNVLAIALNNADSFNQLKAAQNKIIKQEKMAALGMIATRVSHEIQNPLNFVNNFSELSQDMVKDLIESVSAEDKNKNAYELIATLQKINEHGKRASAIVKQLQEHSTKGTSHEFFEGK
ncbi:MAG: GAF domain-containing protein [Bacteroidetes bacterium]|nr:GAF domain-containing protein [Bacteroidota bacterium]